ncbi:MAG TPA: TylF/MycF/NovP-related O-methyltransferase [Terriglobales bacterium]|nr:TylF/MycF/NovP-related O-methyltransferase [Terriglobales bacterium]
MQLRDFGFLRPAWLAVQAISRRCGFEVTYARVTGIPDADLYWPFFQPWRAKRWDSILRSGDPRSLVLAPEKYILLRHAEDAVVRCPGDFAECGVYRGGTAYLLAELAAKHNRRVSLFDTFEGMPETDPTKDRHKQGDFADVSLAGVQQYLSPFNNVDYFPGLIPGTLAAVSDRRFCFVHIDLDIYNSIHAATEFFYPRMASGGVIVYDDYGYPSCPGARMAIDEFYSGKCEIPTVIGPQCIVRKL